MDSIRGKALCLLSRGDFMERVPKNGDVLFNSLYTLISKQAGTNLPVQVSPKKEPCYPYPENRSPPTPSNQHDAVGSNVLIMPPVTGGHISLAMASNPLASLRQSPYVPIRPQSFISVPGRNIQEGLLKSFPKEAVNMTESLGYSSVSLGVARSETDHSFDVFRHDRSSECRLLWEFIYQLLCNTKYSSYVCWENKEDFVFRIINPTGLAELWGQQKNRTNMTYEKLSRALRYYYRMNIIKKVPGKRLTYRFLQSPNKIQKGQRGAKPQYKLPMDFRDKGETGHSTGATVSGVTVKTESDDTSEGSIPVQEDHEDSCSIDDIHEEEEDDSMCDVDEVGEENFTNSASSPHIANEQTLGNGSFKIERPDSRPNSCENSTLKDVTNADERVPDGEYARLPGLEHSPSNKFLTPVFSHHLSMTDLVSQNRRVYRARSTDTQPLSPSLAHSPFLNRVSLSPPYYDVTDARAVQHHRVLDSCPRSRSCEFAQSFQFPNYPFRPVQPRSASPRSILQSEPEDLSVRSRSNSSASSATSREARRSLTDSDLTKSASPS